MSQGNKWNAISLLSWLIDERRQVHGTIPATDIEGRLARDLGFVAADGTC